MASPFERSAMDAYPSKAAWDAAAVGLLGSMLERWHLVDAVVYPATAAAVVAAVRRGDGSPAVLKIGYPHPEAIWEAVVLAALPRDLAPALLDQDVWTWAMLIERLDPGATLGDAGLPTTEAAEVGADLHRRLVATPPPPGVEPLIDQYRPFVDRMAQDAAVAVLRDAGVPENAVANAVEEFTRLCGTAPRTALLHGDLNPSNVVRHGSGWRIIDPKPATGDPAFDTFSLVRDLLPDTGSPQRLEELTAVAADGAGVDAGRALRWVRVRATLSAFWILEDGFVDRARRDLDLVRSAQELLGW